MVEICGANSESESLKLILAITANSPCPVNCPNYKNKPSNDGCGMDVCLDTIEIIAKSAINS